MSIVVIPLTLDIKLPDISYPVLTSDISNNTLRLAEIANQLDQLIYIKNQNIDLVYVVNETVDFSFSPAQLNYAYYDSNDLHRSSFYCSPGVFSIIGSLYKIDLSKYQFSNIDIDSKELLAERIFWLLNRAGVEYKIGK